MQLLSVFGGGLFIIPAITLFGAIFFGYKAFVSSKSGSTQQDINGTKNVDGNTINKGYLIFSIICLVATIAIIIAMVSDK